MDRPIRPQLLEYDTSTMPPRSASSAAAHARVEWLVMREGGGDEIEGRQVTRSVCVLAALLSLWLFAGLAPIASAAPPEFLAFESGPVRPMA